jgi:hypothetical protein
MEGQQAAGLNAAQGWLHDDIQPAPGEYRKLMLANLPEYHGPPKQSWRSHVRCLEMAWAASRVPEAGV